MIRRPPKLLLTFLERASRWRARCKCWYDFQAYMLRYGIRGREIHWADCTDFVPFLLDDWITREQIKDSLIKENYEVKTFPNPFRINAYKDGEQFIIDCPDTSEASTPWGMRKGQATVSLIPVKWVRQETVNSYLITDIPNRSGLVGVEEKGKHFSEMASLMLKWGDVITPFGSFKKEGGDVQ